MNEVQLKIHHPIVDWAWWIFLLNRQLAHKQLQVARISLNSDYSLRICYKRSIRTKKNAMLPKITMRNTGIKKESMPSANPLDIWMV